MKCRQFMLLLLSVLITIPGSSLMTTVADAQDSAGHIVAIQPLTPTVARLRADEVARLEDQALQGSADAALKLARNSSSLGNQADRVHWLMIGVENGDAAMRFDLARALSQGGDDSSKIRARYWYERIIADGPPDQSALAKRELESWDWYEKKYQTHYKPD